MLPMFLGQANYQKNFWSASWWVPLSKLTYLVYLIFPVINLVFMSSAEESLFLSYFTMAALFAANWTLCFIGAFFVHILIEAPLMNLILSKQIRKVEMKDKRKAELYYLDDTVIKDQMRLTEVIESEQYRPEESKQHPYHHKVNTSTPFTSMDNSGSREPETFIE